MQAAQFKQEETAYVQEEPKIRLIARSDASDFLDLPTVDEMIEDEMQALHDCGLDAIGNIYFE